MKIGDVITYVDHVGEAHDAFVTAVWDLNQEPGYHPSINLVYVSTDEDKKDPYGRQIERDTSVVHKANQSAHGNYWVEK